MRRGPLQRGRKAAAAGAILAGLGLLLAGVIWSAGAGESAHPVVSAGRRGAAAGGPGQSPSSPGQSPSSVSNGRSPAGPPRPRGAARSRRGPGLHRLLALGRPIYCGGAYGREIALTFDDGPGPYTRFVIRKLRKHGERATFFAVGRNIPLVGGITRQERALGAVGDHTFTHPLLTGIPPARAEREIVSAQRALTRSSGGPVFLFRAPYEGRNARIDAIAAAHGLLEILWNVDSRDSLGAGYRQIERNVIAGLRPGAIVLMHENRGQTVRALLSIFAAIRHRGLRAVSLPQLLADDPPSIAQVRAGGHGCGVRAASGRSGG